MSVVQGSPNVLFSGWDPEQSEWHGITHVVYTGDPSDDQVRWGGNADPRGVLTPGDTYELEKVLVHSWHTKIILKGIDCGVGFNSVSFRLVNDEEVPD